MGKVNNIYNRLFKPYSDADFELSLKIRFIYSICFLIIIVFPILMSWNIFDRGHWNLTTEIPMIMMIVVALAGIKLLMQGEYNYVSSSIIVISHFVFWWVFSKDIVKDNNTATITYLYSISALVPFAVKKTKHMFYYFSVNTVLLLGFLIRYRFNEFSKMTNDYVVDHFFAYIFIIFFIYFFSYMTSETMKRFLIEKEKNKKLSEQKLESISTISAGVAHEINTPLQYLADNLSFLDDSSKKLAPLLEALDDCLHEKDTKDIKKKLEYVMRDIDVSFLSEEIPAALRGSLDGVGKISEIVKAMNYFIVQGIRGLVKSDLTEIIKDTVVVSRKEWKQVLDIKLDLEEDLPLLMLAPSEICQLIISLVTNSVHAVDDKYQGKGRGILIISTSYDDKYVYMDVKDDGGGISDEISEKVFEPFFTTKDVGQGMGHGLTIAYTIVSKIHNGIIQVVPCSDGAHIRVSFPR